MTKQQKQYYYEMAKRNRLFFYKNNIKLKCLITFYLGNKKDIRNFINADPWYVLEDNSKGNNCYISQLLTDKIYENRILSYKVWNKFKDYVRRYYPLIESIYWRRYKNNKLYEFQTKI